MTPKVTWAEKLKRWQKGQNEATARALMSPPAKTTLLQSIPFPGVVIIMGSRGSGKTGLAHEIMSQLHNRRRLGGALLLPTVPRGKSRVLPSWVKVVMSISQLPKRSVCIIDEAAQVAHARRSQSATAVQLDNLVSISRHRQQLILFISHHSRKLDLNLIHDSDRILWKQPTEAHALFERDELQLFTRKALEFFAGIKGEKARQKATYIMDLHHLQFTWFNNSLPSWWSETISHGFQDYR
ncbi:hypothetical protein ES703_62235 [subsurface metagenome]